MSRRLIAFTLPLVLAACAKNQPAVRSAARSEIDRSRLGGGAEYAATRRTSDVPVAARTSDASQGAQGPVSFAPIYFHYDSAELDADATARLREIADHLRNSPGARLTASGHADERGTEEYNIALGDRRAQASREYLSRLGIDAARVHTISYGELRPVAEGHDEAAFARNRRVEFELHDGAGATPAQPR